MHKKILNLLIKQNKDQDYRMQAGLLSSILGVIVNLALFVIKYLIGIATYSLAITADAFNNLFDSLSSLISFFGFKIAAKPADQKHPFGHGRFEKIAELFVSLIIIAFAILMAISSVKNIFNPQTIKFSKLMVVLLIFTSLVKFWQFSFNSYVADKIDSKLLKATAKDSLNDVLINLVIIVGLISEHLFSLKLDGILSLLLSVYIIVGALSMLILAIKELLGHRITDDQLKAMDDLLLSFNEILGYHDLIVHQYGHNRIYASVHIEIDARKTLLAAHDISESIEFAFNKDLNVDLVVHLDPVVLDDEYLADMQALVKDIVYNFNSEYSIHDFRLIKHKNNNIISFDIVVNDDNLSDVMIIQAKSKEIRKFYKKDVYITIDRNYLQLRRDL
ncbi:MAG: cation transporter [Erysipelothrix sp.]|nr:cation transporter [Erysipelothrix sp.]